VPTVGKLLTEQPGTVIGPYKLLEQIGEGGFGVVYMAEQQQPVRRKVALKIIKPGMDSKQVIARFEAERQALAMMDHQNIARVLEAGATDSGRPYFVMELVRGIPITQFCDDNRLTPRERLELFGAVCQAVQHAHQKGIIHRDLKPNNVLVTLHDGTPLVKVIDFGIAKALGQERLTDKTLVTGFSQMLGTPLYMSPEQAEMSGQDADTRTDIYALGVLLYELLTGTTPFDRERLKDASYDEIRRIIREEEPAKPSTRISTLGQAASTASANRKSEPRRLSQLFRGELDWIVMKALEKDRNRRYGTASSFAADVQRYLHDEPVQACPPSAVYRFRKFARRNQIALVAATAVALVLCLAVAGLATSTVLIAREQQATTNALRAETRARTDLEEALERERQLRAQERQNAYYERIALADREWSANNLGRMEQLLEECPANLRGWEWHYLKRLPHGGLPPLRHGGAALSVAISPDGQCIASASRDGFVTIWDAQNGQKLFPSFKAHEGPMSSVAFSPDGHLLAWGGQDSTVLPPRGTVMVWDAKTGQLLRTLEGHSTGISMVAFSPNGQRLASAGWVGRNDERQLRCEMNIWDVTSGQMLLTVPGHEGRMTCVVFSPDGKRLASGCAGRRDNTLTIWDAQTGEEQRTFRGHSQGVQCMAFSPDGRLLASGGGPRYYPSAQEAKVWDGETGRELFTLRGHLGTVFGVAFSPDGRRLASASMDRTVKLWDLGTGKEVLTLRGHLDVVRSVAFSRDSRLLVSASIDQTVHVWDAAPVMDEMGEDPHCLTLPASGGAVTGVAFHPKDHRILAAAYRDGKVRVWDLSLAQPRCFPTLAVDQERGVRALTFSREGQWLAAAANYELKVWNATTYQEVRTIPGDPPFSCVAFSPDEKQVAGAGFPNPRMGYPVQVWDVANDNQPRVLSGNTWTINQVAFSPDGQYLASAGYDGTVRIWDVKTGNRIATPPLTPTCPSYGLAFSPDGKQLALGSNDQVVRVWNTTTWVLLHEYRDSAGVLNVAFSPDGKRLAWGSTDSTVKVWDIPTVRTRSVSPLIHTLRGHTSWVLSVAFSTDGKRIASASLDGKVKIWKVPPLSEPNGVAER
jgi:WD40 repeat protein/tRNA A-37 threonylcarbamoyl transferase component Bud32